MAVESTYPLVSVPASPSPGFTEGEGFSPATFADFIGIGILTPFQRAANDFVNGGGTKFLQSMIGQVLAVRSDSDFTSGELPWRTEFGSILHHLRHQSNDEVREELAQVHVADALARWIPQIRLKAVVVSAEQGPDGRNNVLRIVLRYDVIGLNQAGNEVLIPDVDQTVTLQAA